MKKLIDFHIKNKHYVFSGYVSSKRIVAAVALFLCTVFLVVRSHAASETDIAGYMVEGISISMSVSEIQGKLLDSGYSASRTKMVFNKSENNGENKHIKIKDGKRGTSLKIRLTRPKKMNWDLDEIRTEILNKLGKDNNECPLSGNQWTCIFMEEIENEFFELSVNLSKRKSTYAIGKYLNRNSLSSQAQKKILAKEKALAEARALGKAKERAEARALANDRALVNVSAPTEAAPVPLTVKAARYTVNGDNTISDNVTGLMWQQEDNNSERNWKMARAYCENLVVSPSTYSDWRLPDIKELYSIVDQSQYDPAIDSTVFPNTKSLPYWSYTTFSTISNRSWFVKFKTGEAVGIGKQTGKAYVRCVRGERTYHSFTDNGDGTVTYDVTGLMWQQKVDHRKRNWMSALTYCENLEVPNTTYSDWRLPNINELNSIVDHLHFNPSVNRFAFPNTISWKFWSSTEGASIPGLPALAWYVYFANGHVNANSKEGLMINVRCVRGIGKHAYEDAYSYDDICDDLKESNYGLWKIECGGGY